jgi:hypothetical protein
MGWYSAAVVRLAAHCRRKFPMSSPLDRRRRGSNQIGMEYGEAFRRLPPHVFAESVNSEGRHLPAIRTSGKESERGTEINFPDGNNPAAPAFARPCVVKL